MANESQAIIDKKHGFMRFIIRNQHERDRYDKEQRLKKLSLSNKIDHHPDKNQIEALRNNETTTNAKEKNYIFEKSGTISTSANRINFSSLQLSPKDKVCFHDFEMVRMYVQEQQQQQQQDCNNKTNYDDDNNKKLHDCVPTKLGIKP